MTLNGECTIGYLPQTMRVADTTTLAEETAKAFDEVLRLGGGNRLSDARDLPNAPITKAQDTNSFCIV